MSIFRPIVRPIVRPVFRGIEGIKGAGGHAEGDILFQDHHLVGPVGTDWTTAFGGTVGGGAISLVQFGSVENATLVGVIGGNSYTVSWPVPLVSSGAVTMRIGTFGTLQINNGDTSATVVANGANLDTLTINDALGNGGGTFVLTGPITINNA